MFPFGRLGRALGRAETERASDAANAETRTLLYMVNNTSRVMS